MNCTKSHKRDQKIRERLARHAARTAELVSEGMDRMEASRQAFREINAKRSE